MTICIKFVNDNWTILKYFWKPRVTVRYNKYLKIKFQNKIFIVILGVGIHWFYLPFFFFLILLLLFIPMYTKNTWKHIFVRFFPPLFNPFGYSLGTQRNPFRFVISGVLDTHFYVRTHVNAFIFTNDMRVKKLHHDSCMTCVIRFFSFVLGSTAKGLREDFQIIHNIVNKLLRSWTMELTNCYYIYFTMHSGKK